MLTYPFFNGITFTFTFYTINSNCNVNEQISRQPVPYGPHFRHNIYLLQQMKYLQKFRKRLQHSLEFSKLHWKYRCKHIRLLCPPNSVSQYFNYRQYHSVVLQAAVDAKLKFVTVDVEAYAVAYRGWVGLEGSTPSLRNSEGPPKSFQAHPDCENC